MAVFVQGALFGALEHGHMAVAGVCARLDGFTWPAPGQATRLDGAQSSQAHNSDDGEPDSCENPRPSDKQGRSQHGPDAQPCGHGKRLPGFHQPGRCHATGKPTRCLGQVGARRGHAGQSAGQGEAGPPYQADRCQGEQPEYMLI